jgi:Fe2+ transport system protein FeoA
VLLLVAIGCVTGVICTVVGCASSTIASVHRRRLDHELKQELLDRGMNADEVAQVVEASAPKDFLDRLASGSKKWGRRSPPVRAS